MIFVTIGTHEQGMDRLLKEIDELINEGKINEKVIIQGGYSQYKPKNFENKKIIDYKKMDEYIKEARIVITHGGPGSIFNVLKYKKIPIVVPRDSKYNEHVDNHQILFTNRLEKENKIIAVYNIKELHEKLENYNELSKKCNYDRLNKDNFTKQFSDLVNKLLYKDYKSI